MKVECVVRWLAAMAGVKRFRIDMMAARGFISRNNNEKLDVHSFPISLPLPRFHNDSFCSDINSCTHFYESTSQCLRTLYPILHNCWNATWTQQYFFLRSHASSVICDENYRVEWCDSTTSQKMMTYNRFHSVKKLQREPKKLVVRNVVWSKRRDTIYQPNDTTRTSART